MYSTFVTSAYRAQTYFMFLASQEKEELDTSNFVRRYLDL
jgi:hypothetical protein